jgi:hypothetical protein
MTFPAIDLNPVSIAQRAGPGRVRADEVSGHQVVRWDIAGGQVQQDPSSGIARNQVPRAGRGAANGVVGSALANDAVTIRQGDRARNIGADVVAFDHVVDREDVRKGPRVELNS